MMGRGRSNFGTHNKPTAKMVSRQKKADKELKAMVRAAIGASAVISKGISKSAKASKKANRPLSPEYIAARAIVEQQQEQEMNEQAERRRIANEERKAKKEARAAEKKPPKPKSVQDIRLRSILVLVIGACFTILFLPIGLAILGVGIWMLISSPKIYQDMNEKYEAWEAAHLIEEIEPDEIDLKMIQEIQNDPDCHTFE